ncbi:twin-arginine translocation signal domain-containing protein [Actinomyces viscosus]|uniref:NAD(P)H nitroreductase RV3131/MT3217 n=1 Tax=Actinomyces viscosus TaxID=1656 RepID=A0A448PN96_ACTVI|nr:twin-arginine translocation signal domain-containing protein [Actinomyces viscosus]TFH52208.1 twin-arginine translocation signal domain-containing protein [Actinomyces viscosus]VEI17722.1 Putative NAD(P)H nitroreductase RV3131/MT3217 [Actinomyces viscosus]
MTPPTSPADQAAPGTESTRLDASDAAPAHSDRQPRKGRRLSRRTALKAAGIGGAALATGATGIAVRGATNGVWSAGRGAPYELWRQWTPASPGLRGIVAAATLAANPHNIQPWLFTVDAADSPDASTGRIDLHADPGRLTPLCDPDGRERTAGFGCALYSIEVAARAQGKQAQVESWPDGGSEQSDHVARVSITDADPPASWEQELAAAIPRRHTYRGPFTARMPERTMLDSLTGAAPQGARIVWVTEPSAVAALGDLYVEATQAIANDAEMSADSFAWMRNDRSQIDAHRDGLTLDCQGLSDAMLAAAKILPAQSRESSDSFWVKSTREVHTATARAYGIVCVDDVSEPRNRLDGGRLLQHVHLAATAAGLGLHHMNQVSERIARDTAQGLQDRFSQRWATITDVPAPQSLLAFRVGFPERTVRPSPRRALNDLVRGTNG